LGFKCHSFEYLHFFPKSIFSQENTFYFLFQKWKKKILKKIFLQSTNSNIYYIDGQNFLLKASGWNTLPFSIKEENFQSKMVPIKGGFSQETKN